MNFNSLFVTHLVGGHISCKPDEVHSFFNNEILPSKTIESGNQYKINVCFTGQNYIQDFFNLHIYM